jgi:glutamate-1-semialdehyde 2,1-aminomutase
MLIQQVGSILYLHFTSKNGLRNYRDTVDSNRELYARFVEELAYEGVHANPRGLWYVSTAHSSEDISFTVKAARSVMQRLAERRESRD